MVRPSSLPLASVLRVPVAAFAVLAVAAPMASAQTRFPFEVVRSSPDGIELAPDTAALAELAAREELFLTDVPVPGGERVALVLERVRLDLGPGALHVDGRPAREAIDSTLSLWSGRVAGHPDSDAFLAFSRFGSRGWFGPHGHLTHLLAEPGADGEWDGARGRLLSSARLAAAGQPELRCSLLTPPGGSVDEGPSGGAPEAAGTLYDAPIAFETDYEFYALFGDMNAAQHYALMLIGAVGSRYREQCDVIFTVPYLGFWSTNTDPWTSTDCNGRLDQFRLAWRNGRAPVRASLYHLISGVRVNGCGGVAYLSVICNQSYGFGMSAHVNGRFTWPVYQQSLAWDFFVLAHELGHQFGTPHTHDYNPRIDNCAGGQCISNGTIMSYCHTCPGGMNNVTLRFHQRVVDRITNTVQGSCLRPFEGILEQDLGAALPGSNGTPAQTVGYGSQTVSVDVAHAPVNQVGAVFVGFSAVNQPLFGGVLVPSPDVALPLASDAAGDASHAFGVAAPFPSGVTVWMHSWFVDTAGSNTLAASNATRVELIKP